MAAYIQAMPCSRGGATSLFRAIRLLALPAIAALIWHPAAVQAGEAEAYQHLAERMDQYFTAEQPRLIEAYAAPYPSAPTFSGSSQRLAFIYDAALALAAFVDRGTTDDLRRAKLIADAFLWYQQHDVFADGRLRQAYWADQDLSSSASTRPNIPGAFTQCNTGENAFVGGALLTYFNKVRNPAITNPLSDPNAAYLQAAINIGNFLVNETYDGDQPGFFAGFKEQGSEMAVGVPVSSYGAIQTTPTTIRIPLSAFSSQNLNLERIKAISLVFNDALRPTGSITFQSIKFVNTVTGASRVVDNYADINRFANTLGFGVGAIDQAIFGSHLTGRTIIWNSADGSIDWWYSLLIADPAVWYHRFDAADYTHLELNLTGGTGGERFTVELQGYPLAQVLDQTKISEHNIDTYAFIMRLADITGNPTWPAYAQSAKTFIDTVARDPADGKIRVGQDPNGIVNQAQFAEDTNSWSVLAFGRPLYYGAGLTWVDSHLAKVSDGFAGFDFGINTANPSDALPDGVWFEGTAHMVVAYQVAGRTSDANYYLGQLDSAQLTATNANSKGLVAASHDNVTTGFGWGYNSSLHIGATAWYIAAKRHLNPFWGTSTSQPVPHSPACYVLTAAFGHPQHPVIQSLWAAHHRIVGNQWDAPWHQAYMRWYDQVGPKIAAWLSDKPRLKVFIRRLANWAANAYEGKR